MLDFHCASSTAFYGAVFLLSLFLLGAVYIYQSWRRKRMEMACGDVVPTFNGYSIDPPNCWKFKFPQARFKTQSPINITTRDKITCGNSRPLIFNEQYFLLPKSITILNDGYGDRNWCILKPRWKPPKSYIMLVGTCFKNDYPTIVGGPLRNPYRFNLAQFKWGPTDHEGSEHTINSKRYAMELQLMHIKGEKCYENLECAVNDKAVLFVSYFFEVGPFDNPYLTPMMKALSQIRSPNNSFSMEPFPLCWLFNPFKSKYYYYPGSLTQPPCTEGVDWIIQPEPLTISSQQLRTFRRLKAIDGPMRDNTRPTQNINGRPIYYYN